MRRIIVAMLLGVLLYGAFVIYGGYRQIGHTLAGFRWWTFAAALGLACANYGLRFLKWEYYLARLRIRGVPKLDSFLIFLSGFVLTVTPGKVGEVFKSAVLNATHGVATARTAPIIVAERLTDVIGVISLIVLGSIGFSGGLRWAAVGSVCVALGMLLILWEAPGRFCVQWLEGRQGRLQSLAPKVREALASLRLLASPAALLWPSLLSVLGWGCEGFSLYLLLEGFGTSLSVPLAVFFYATATLAGAIIPVPGGLGVAETMIQEQLVRLGGAPQATATSAMILVRFATLWWAVLVGFGALALLRRRFPGLMHDQGQKADSVIELEPSP